MNTVGRACALGIVFGSAACSSDLGPSGNPAGEKVATASFAATSDWTVVPTENSGTGDNVLASVSGSAENDVWAVGQIIPDDSANVTRTLAHHYDGKKWTPVHTPNVGSHANALLGVATHGDKAWAVGYYFDETFAGRSLVEAWDGDAWAIADHPQVGHEDHLTGVSAAGANDVWAVGWVRDSAGTFSTLVERFDGGAWHVVPAPNPGALGNILYGVLARSADDVWAVGQKVGTHGPDEGLILHWDGQRFTESPSPSNGANSAELLGVSAAPGGPVRAIGDGEDFTSGTKVVAEADSGGGWIREAIPSPGAADNRLEGIVALAGGVAYAVGETLDVGSGNDFTLIERNDGQKWTRVASPNPNPDGENLLASVAEVGSDLWAVGAFDGPNALQTLILHRSK